MVFMDEDAAYWCFVCGEGELGLGLLFVNVSLERWGFGIVPWRVLHA
jgi:hypothetical protein